MAFIVVVVVGNLGVGERERGGEGTTAEGDRRGGHGKGYGGTKGERGGLGWVDDECMLTGEIMRSLLNDPNTSSPANVEASNLYKDNRREYTKRVKETVEKSWED